MHLPVAVADAEPKMPAEGEKEACIEFLATAASRATRCAASKARSRCM
jgi:hypothetical protein